MIKISYKDFLHNTLLINFLIIELKDYLYCLTK